MGLASGLVKGRGDDDDDDEDDDEGVEAALVTIYILGIH